MHAPLASPGCTTHTRHQSGAPVCYEARSPRQPVQSCPAGRSSPAAGQRGTCWTGQGWQQGHVAGRAHTP
eukprot:517711-Pelagomonas_calceolata.AAC.3